MSSILITGGSGFVGKHLIPRLVTNGYEITSLTRKISLTDSNLKTIALDLSNYDPNKNSIAKQFEIIIHLASTVSVNEMINNPKDHLLNNINSTLNLLEDIRINNPNCLLIFLSSEKVYGGTVSGQNNGNIFEEGPANPSEPYGVSKLTSEELIKAYHQSYGIRYIILRLGNIFGPGQKPELFIPSVITKIISNPQQVNIGNLEVYRNFIYIQDACGAILKCLNNPPAINQTFNLASYNLKIKEVLQEILKLAHSYGIQPNIVQDQSLFRVSETGIETSIKRGIINCGKANTILGWMPKYLFSEAIKTTFESYLSIKNKENGASKL